MQNIPLSLGAVVIQKNIKYMLLPSPGLESGWVDNMFLISNHYPKEITSED